MSLTSFLEEKDVVRKFRQAFVKPKPVAEKPLLAPPLTDHDALITIAFGYLLRFLTKRH